MLHPEIIWENESALACVKPSGWLSVPSRMGAEDPRPVLGLWLQDTLRCQIYPLHRLDLEVSGLMLYAKTAEAHRALSVAWESHQIQKVYAAWTLPTTIAPKKYPTEWHDRIAKGKKRAFTAPHGKNSVTAVLAVAPTELPSHAQGLLWHLAPITGRSHQLRFALASRGAPIIGDALYGSQEKWHESPGIGLRAVSLECVDRALSPWLPWPDQKLKIGLGFSQ